MSEPEMSKDSPAKSKDNIGRIALILAGILAVGAVGVQVYRSTADDETPASVASVQTGEEAPSVNEVIAGLEKKLQDNPDDAESWRMLGWSYFETQKFAESATAMKRATSLDPDNPEYWSMLGEALVMSSDGTQVPPDAAKAFDKALALDKTDPRARYFLAVRKDIAGDHQGAINDWFALLEDTPADAPYAGDVRRVIAQVAEKEGIDVADRLAKVTPAAPTGGMSTDGPAVATAAIPGPSRQQMQEAASLPPGQQEAMIAQMVDGLDERLKSSPDDPNGWIMLMRSRMQLGQTVQAQQARDRALAAFKNDGAEAKRIREAAAALGIGG
ncbi:cytochrome c-type biogenesis protein CcmH [Parasphingorhabdus marina DSM 22363]|uniref:Cytochrome c-type biogenesis protein CcmH n=1 Tax=Parasphingorhabdus marina DSM 22363 TaxID=1123272 RepID=A0A1N6CYW0_9SPHN|nr:tetratricopeptide repeat protein [Parasphingorhabdus marina]SIN63633.1 cytochrome c-type biogenesis protein CcmH [Parasphingorhabdus marina DSM 22363]